MGDHMQSPATAFTAFFRTPSFWNFIWQPVRGGSPAAAVPKCVSADQSVMTKNSL